MLLDENWRQFAEFGLMGRATRVEQAIVNSDSSTFTLPLRVHAWYGVNAVVRGAGSMECDLVVEGKAFPHPSLVNLFIRRGLSTEARLHLGAWHEVGHLQTLPFAALFALALVAAIVPNPRRLLRRLVAATIGIEVVWELASESYVAAKVGMRAYRRAYAKPSPNLALFWLGGVAAAVAAVATALGRDDQKG